MNQTSADIYQEKETGLIKVGGRNAFQQMSERLQLIKELLTEKMVLETDYGIIPGCKNPSLYQPGAEKIGVLFGLKIQPMNIEDLSQGDEVRFRAEMTASDSNGNFLGAVFSECSSFEEKYRWRKSVCDEEWNDTTETRRREKWFKGFKNNSPYKQKQVLRDPEDLRNTILFMAQKRGFVSVIRRVTGASEIFTQEGEINHDGQPKERPDIKPPQQTKPAEKNNVAEKPDFISENLSTKLRSMVADFEFTEIEVQEILKEFGFDSIECITNKAFPHVKKNLELKGKYKANAQA